MTPEQTVTLIEMYERRLHAQGVKRVRIDPRRTFASLSMSGILAHAHFLCDGVKKLATDPEKQRKMGSHLSVIQMCLSFAGWYTLEELLEHNRSNND